MSDIQVQMLKSVRRHGCHCVTIAGRGAPRVSQSTYPDAEPTVFDANPMGFLSDRTFSQRDSVGDDECHFLLNQIEKNSQGCARAIDLKKVLWLQYVLWYCCREHQLANWKTHKKTCKKLAMMMYNKPIDLAGFRFPDMHV